MVFSLLSSLVRFTITRTAYEYELRGTDGNRDAGCMEAEWKDTEWKGTEWKDTEWKDTEWKDIEWKDTEWKDTEWKDSAGPWLAHRSRYERDMNVRVLAATRCNRGLQRQRRSSHCWRLIDI